MAIHSFLKADKNDPDWQFSPDDYFDKEFKIIDASTVELNKGQKDIVVLRQNPTEKELLAKHIKIFIHEDAMLEMTILNEVDDKLQQVFLYDVHLKPGANLSLGLFAKDGKFNKHIIQVFQEDQSKFTVYGLISNTVGGDTEVITKIAHQGEESTSNQLFLGMAGAESQTVYQGIVVVEPEAVNSELMIESSNLVIEPTGRCYSKPETYINADFVASSYASETDTLSLENVCYLQSRGLTEDQARNMLVSGFKNQVINLIPKDNIRDEVQEMYSE